MIRSHEVDLGEDVGAMEGDGKLLELRNWVSVGDRDSVERTVVSKRTPVVG